MWVFKLNCQKYVIVIAMISEEMKINLLRKVVELHKEAVGVAEKIAEETKRENVSDFLLILNTVLLDAIRELIEANLEYHKHVNKKVDELIKKKLKK